VGGKVINGREKGGGHPSTMALGMATGESWLGGGGNEAGTALILTKKPANID